MPYESTYELIQTPTWVDREINPRHQASTDDPLGYRNWGAQLTDAGVSLDAIDELDDLARLVDGAATVLDALAENRETSTTIEDLAAQVVAGKLDPAKAVAKAAPLDAVASPDGPVAALVAATRRRYAAQAHQLLASIGDRFITDAIRPAVDQLTAELPELVARIPAHCIDGLDTEARQDTATREAWGRILDTIGALGRIYDITDAMRDAKVIPVRPGAWTGDYRFTDTGPLAGIPTDGPGTVRLVLTAVRAGVLPTVLTQAEVDDLHLASNDGPAAA